MRILRQRQETDQDVGARQKRREPVPPMIAVNTIHLSFRAAPCGKREAEGFQSLHDGLSEHAKAEDTDPLLGCLAHGKREPGGVGLLANIGLQLAVQSEYGERHIFLHHPDDAVLDHPDEDDVRGQRPWFELVDPGADREDHLQIPEAMKIGRRSPREDVADLFRVILGNIHRKRQIGQVACKSLGEDEASLSIRIEPENHGCPLSLAGCRQAARAFARRQRVHQCG